MTAIITQKYYMMLSLKKLKVVLVQKFKADRLPMI